MTFRWPGPLGGCCPLCRQQGAFREAPPVQLHKLNDGHDCFQKRTPNELIKPYKWESMWVFDEEAHGLEREPVG